jgi:hypothetical protein
MRVFIESWTNDFSNIQDTGYKSVCDLLAISGQRPLEAGLL